MNYFDDVLYKVATTNGDKAKAVGLGVGTAALAGGAGYKKEQSTVRKINNRVQNARAATEKSQLATRASRNEINSLMPKNPNMNQMKVYNNAMTPMQARADVLESRVKKLEGIGESAIKNSKSRLKGKWAPAAAALGVGAGGLYYANKKRKESRTS